MTRAQASNDHDLRIEINQQGYRVSPREWKKMEGDLATLRKLIETFPKAELKVEISQQSAGTVRAATSLRLAGRTLFASDEHRWLHPAWEKCVRRLVSKVRAYKERLSNKPLYAKQAEGTVQTLGPARDPRADAVLRAVEELDYVAFRQVLDGYEEPIERRVGRWVQRYAEAELLLASGEFTIRDLVEEVFLNAFERFGQRPAVPLSQWLEDLIDNAIQAILAHPEEEKENVRLAEAALQTPELSSAARA